MPLIGSFGGILNVYEFDNSVFKTADSFSNPNTIGSLCNVKLCWAGSGLVCGVNDTGLIPIFEYGFHHGENNIRVIRRLQVPQSSSAAFFNWNNTNLVVGNKHGAVSMWDIKAKKEIYNLVGKATKEVKYVTVNIDDDCIAAGGSSDVIELFSCQTNKLVCTLSMNLGLEEEMTDLVFAPSIRNHLAGCSSKSSIAIWDIIVGTSILNLENVHDGACTGLAYSPTSSNVIVTISSAQTLTVHDIREKKTVLKFNTLRALSCVDVIQENSMTLVGSADGFITAFDLRKVNSVAEIKAHNKKVMSIKAAYDRKVCKLKAFRDLKINTPDETICNKTNTLAGVESSNASEVNSNFDVPSPCAAEMKTVTEVAAPLDKMFSVSQRRHSNPTPAMALAMHNLIKSSSQMSPYNQKVNESPSFLEQMFSPKDNHSLPISSPRSTSSDLNGIPLTTKGDCSENDSLRSKSTTFDSTNLFNSVITEIRAMRLTLATIKKEAEEALVKSNKATQLIVESQEKNKCLMLDAFEQVLFLKELIKWRLNTLGET